MPDFMYVLIFVTFIASVVYSFVRFLLIWIDIEVYSGIKMSEAFFLAIGAFIPNFFPRISFPGGILGLVKKGFLEVRPRMKYYDSKNKHFMLKDSENKI